MSGGQVKHVAFVLGAGASSDAGLPLYRHLLDPSYLDQLGESLEELRKGGIGDSPYFEWKNWIEEYLKRECQWFRRQCDDFEILLSDLDTPTRRVAHLRLLKYYRELIAFGENLAGYSAPRIFYIRCFALWLKNLRAAGYNVSILSFNHDLLLERLMNEQEIPFNYGLSENQHGYFELTAPPGTKWEVIPASAYPIRAGTAGGSELLKLHGSNNWIVCEAGHITYHPEEAFLTKRDLKGCPKCGRSARPCVIPPQRIKEYKALKKIWACAQRILQKAKAVIFIGYSLPEYDKHAYELFRENVASTTSIGVLTRSSESKTRTRFDSIPHSDIEFFKGPFAEWIELQVLHELPHLIYEKYPELVRDRLSDKDT